MLFVSEVQVMGHVRGHQFPIKNGTHNLRSSLGYEKVPVWTGNEGIFQNNARNLTRKYQESFHAIGGYNNGPASKKRRETNINSAFNFNNGVPFARRLEDSACSSWGINNNLAFNGRREESSCNIAAFTGSSALARKEEESICHSASFDNEPVLRRVERSNSIVGSSSEVSDHYLSREEIERCSPSRKDGIDLQKETYFRYSYCAFLQTLGMRLQLPQTTIATAMVYCHRFFLRRSHASHDRFFIATSAMFLAAKSEESPRPLNSVLIVSYEICHKNELANFHYSLPNDWFEQYKQQILQAEQLLLTTLDFEIAVQHPYNPLMSVFNKIGLAQTVLINVAWNLVSEGLRSSLCLQFKPQHIAAGAAFLAARFLNVDLSSNQTMWQEFQTTPTILQDVVQQLGELCWWHSPQEFKTLCR